jgi:hypothetical protein
MPPESITIDDPCRAGRHKRLTATVSGADAVEFTYGNVQQIVSRPGSGGACANWSASFDFVFDRTGVINVVPILGNVRGPAKAVDVELSDFAAASVYRVSGPIHQNSTAELKVYETAQDGQPVFSRSYTVAHGDVQDIELTRCVTTRIDFSYTINGSEQHGPLPERMGHPDGIVLGPVAI